MIIYKSIKNIIFDLGEVLFDVDYKLTFEAFKRLGVDNFDEVYSKIRQTPLFDNFESGSISADTFRAGLRKYIPKPVNNKDIDNAWDAMLIGMPKDRLKLLEQLKNKYRLFLLSNTNELHIKAISKILHNNYGFKNLSHLFEKEYYSFKTGLRKPDFNAFELILSENGLIPGETLFIDDTKMHIDAAKKSGIITYHFQQPETLKNIALQIN
ncbi:MAG: HAD family phosphatase [Bacteroidota bacterium]